MRESIYIADMVLAPSGAFQSTSESDARTREIRVDSRPSDVINVAARTGAPIYIADDVLRANARPATELLTPKPLAGPRKPHSTAPLTSPQNPASSTPAGMNYVPPSVSQSSHASAPNHRDLRHFLLPGRSHNTTTKSMQQLPSPRQREHRQQNHRQQQGMQHPQMFRRSSNHRSSTTRVETVLWLRARLSAAVVEHNFRLADTVKDELAHALGCRTSAALLYELEHAVYYQRFEDAAQMRDELARLQSEQMCGEQQQQYSSEKP